MLETLYESTLTSLPLVARGKVRDIYAVGDDHLLIVTTDRLSAFDVVLPDPVPGKGVVLTAVSNFWFERTRPIVSNHLAAWPLAEVLPDPQERARFFPRMGVERIRWGGVTASMMETIDILPRNPMNKVMRPELRASILRKIGMSEQGWKSG